MNMKMLVVVLLAVLVLMSFVQGIQINNLEESLEDVDLNSAQKSSGSPTGTYSNQRGNVPAMVGGC
jgi:outer membrane lipoprotein-sorting protein